MFVLRHQGLSHIYTVLHKEKSKIQNQFNELKENCLAALLLPAERLLQAVDGLACGLQDALSVPDPDLPGSGLKTDGADGKQLTITSPRHPRPAVVPGGSRLHLLWVHAQYFNIEQMFD